MKEIICSLIDWKNEQTMQRLCPGGSEVTMKRPQTLRTARPRNDREALRCWSYIYSFSLLYVQKSEMTEFDNIDLNDVDDLTIFAFLGRNLSFRCLNLERTEAGRFYYYYYYQWSHSSSVFIYASIQTSSEEEPIQSQRAGRKGWKKRQRLFTQSR